MNRIRLAWVVILVTVAACDSTHSYDCMVTRSCPGVDPTTVEFLNVCGSSSDEAKRSACEGEPCPCSASCTLASSDPLFC